MRHLARIFSSLSVMILVMTQSLYAQNDDVIYVDDDENVAFIIEDLNNYMQQISALESNISVAQSVSQAKILSSTLEAINTQWQLYTQDAQTDIVASEELMQLVSMYSQLYSEATDSVNKQIVRIEAIADFNAAKEFIYTNKVKHNDMRSQAAKLSLTSKTADKLELLKAEEQLLFASLQEAYSKAKTAADGNPLLAPQMKELDNTFAALAAASKEVQEAAYMSPILRLKDYLISLACVTLMLMFVHMVYAKIKALKAARDAAKKYKDMMKTNNQDYPTI